MKKSCLLWTLVFLLLIGRLPLAAQEAIKAEPVATGYTGFVLTLETAEQKLVPLINPILLVPLGERWLIEAEFEIEGEFEREKELGQWQPWEREIEREIEYLQVDFLAHRYLTVVAGRYLTPFGIFNERLHPIWIKKLQPNPIIFPIATGSSNGLMLRGGLPAGSHLNVAYTGYFSAVTQLEAIEAHRTAGGRFSLFFPDQRFELGGSFQRRLGDERFDNFGFDLTWQLKPVPLDIRAEYAQSEAVGIGYWIEGSYRFLRKNELAARVEQFFAPLVPSMVEPGGHGHLPDVDTQRLLAGWNYYFRDGLKFSFAYGRQFSSAGDINIWSLGIAYRFLF